MKARLAAVISWLMTVSYTIFPSHAAKEVKELLYREDQPNVQKEIKWTKSLSQYYAKSLMAAQYEQWDTKSEFRALAKLWGKESAWNPEADNPTSTAFGIAQMLNEKSEDPITQIRNGLRYIEHRYENPCNAWEFWKRNYWY